MIVRLDAEPSNRNRRHDLQKEVFSRGQNFATTVARLAVKCQRLRVLTIQLDDRDGRQQIVRVWEWDVVDRYLKGAMGKGLNESLRAMPKLEILAFEIVSITSPSSWPETYQVTATWIKTKEGGWLDSLENAISIMQTAT